MDQIQKRERQSSPGHSPDREGRGFHCRMVRLLEAEARFSQVQTQVGSAESGVEEFHARRSALVGFASLEVEARFSQPFTIMGFNKLKQMSVLEGPYSDKSPRRRTSL